MIDRSERHLVDDLYYYIINNMPFTTLVYAQHGTDREHSLSSAGVLNLFMVRANMKNGQQAGGSQVYVLNKFGQSRRTPCLHTKDLQTDSDFTHFKFIFINKLANKANEICIYIYIHIIPWAAAIDLQQKKSHIL